MTESARRSFRATAFDEEAVLDRIGREGWRLVGVAPMELIMESTDQAWEYLRITDRSDAAARARADREWTYVTSWFNLHYFARPTGEPASGRGG